MAFLDKFKCDADEHGESCPQWCDLRPGGALKDPPYSAKCTTLFPSDYASEG